MSATDVSQASITAPTVRLHLKVTVSPGLTEGQRGHEVAGCALLKLNALQARGRFVFTHGSGIKKVQPTQCLRGRGDDFRRACCQSLKLPCTDTFEPPQAAS